MVLRSSPSDATTALVSPTLAVPATTASFTVMMMPASDNRASSRAYSLPRIVATTGGRTAAGEHQAFDVHGRDHVVRGQCGQTLDFPAHRGAQFQFVLGRPRRRRLRPCKRVEGGLQRRTLREAGEGRGLVTLPLRFR